MPEWWDDLTNSVSGLFKQPEPKPAVDMNRFGPVLESAGYGRDSAERKLLEAIAGHVNSAPVPKEATMGQKLVGGGLHAIGAGLARGAGASVEGAMQPAQRAFEDWNNRRDLADQGRMGAWKAGGDLVIPSVSSAVTLATNRKLAQDMANRQNARIFGTKADESAAIAPTPGAQPRAPGSPSPLPGITIQPPSPGPAEPQPGAATPKPGAPQGKFGEPQFPLAQNSPIRFHTQRWRDAAVPIMQSIIDENASSIAQGKSDPKTALDKEANTPGSRLSELLAKDKEEWLSSPEYKNYERFQTKNADRSFEEFKGFQERADAASKGKYNIGSFEDALMRHVKEGGTTGPVEDWIGTFKKWANGLGAGYDVSNIEAMHKAAIGAAGEMVKAAIGSRVTQMEFSTFKDAVTSAGLSTAGNLRLLPFLKLQNDAAMEIRNLAAQEMQANNGQLPFDFGARSDAVMEKYNKQAAVLGEQLVQDWKAGKFGPAGSKSAAAPEEQLAPAQIKTITARAKELHAQGMPKEQAAAEAKKQILGAGSPQKVGAPESDPQQQPSPSSETGWNPGKPGTLGGAIKDFGSWMTRPRGPQNLDDVRKLMPQSPRAQETPRSQIWVP